MDAFEKSTKELSRLASLGWSYEEQEIDERQISFDGCSFDPEGNNIEKDGFWAKHRVEIIDNYLKNNSLDLLWEVGAGDGNVAIPLSARNKAVVAVEPLYNGYLALKKTNIIALHSTLEKLKLPPRSIRAVGLFDVLGHAQNPSEILQEIHRVMENDGHLLIAVPAYKWLFSDYDISIQQIRRFSLPEIKNLIETNGFEISRTKYAFATLVPLAILTRLIPYKLGRRNSLQKSKIKTIKISKISIKLDKVLSFLLKLEDKMNFRFGLSIFVFARPIKSYKTGFPAEILPNSNSVE